MIPQYVSHMRYVRVSLREDDYFTLCELKAKMKAKTWHDFVMKLKSAEIKVKSILS